MVDTVLVAMDDSPLSREALAFALDTFPEAEITVVHVAYPEIDMLPADTSEVYDAALDDLDGVGDEAAQAVFESIREVADGRDLSVTFLLGETDRRLVEYTEEGGFDHVVLGTHGREGLSRLLLGSVSEAVVRQTDVPTTLVR
ncbi:UspA domain-containing protein [Halorubrum aidingense JCM 13560]|uniref:UspA domain-containing protein n=1 Tax=Halorubrum aidingense JCM 13560 TaxID=1230454 RepID=M0PG88_9EURY|nr:universal stress protein [Halorubrum aidingense]EMA69066.1 UspA domain-containing protein [Halorubrum aidingense JCM 13560]